MPSKSTDTGERNPEFEAENVSRRGFLKKGVAATVGLLALRTASGAVQAQDVETMTITPDPTGFFVPDNLTRGDREFAGHGPDVEVKAEIGAYNTNELWAEVTMTARETVADWTTVSGSGWYKIWDGDEYGVEEIVDIESDTSTSDRYRDTDHGYDTLSQDGDELVDRFVVRGDTNGKEAGTRTGVKAYFNQIELSIRKVRGVIEMWAHPETTPFFVPKNLTQGDREFAGHGPDVEVKAEIGAYNTNELWAEVTMTARETVADWTTVSGSGWYKIWDGDEYGVHEIVSIESDTLSEDRYTDTDHGYDTLSQGRGELVDRFVVRGDTNGKEAGTRTGMKVYFRPVRLTVRR